jgi:hypothetical protein
MQTLINFVIKWSRQKVLTTNKKKVEAKEKRESVTKEQKIKTNARKYLVGQSNNLNPIKCNHLCLMCDKCVKKVNTNNCRLFYVDLIEENRMNSKNKAI